MTVFQEASGSIAPSSAIYFSDEDGIVHEAQLKIEAGKLTFIAASQRKMCVCRSLTSTWWSWLTNLIRHLSGRPLLAEPDALQFLKQDECFELTIGWPTFDAPIRFWFVKADPSLIDAVTDAWPPSGSARQCSTDASRTQEA
jgi:hypothetical protein